MMLAWSQARTRQSPVELGPDGAFMTGCDLLIDGGVLAAIRAGRVQLSLCEKEHPHGNRAQAPDGQGTGRLVHR